MASDLTDTPKTIAKLGGFPLLASASVKWRLLEGVEPCIESFDMIPGDAASLIAMPGPVKLELISNERTVTVEGLYVLSASPGPNPSIARVTVADRRYWWRYPHIGPRRYNMRRKVGEKRVDDWDQSALTVSIPDFAFAPYSTRNPLSPIAGNVADRWDADDIVLDVLASLDAAEKKAFGVGFGKPIANGDAFGDLQLIEDLEIDDKGDAAAMRVLRASPGLSLFVNLAGQVVLFNKTGGGELGAAANLGPEMTSGGHLTPITNANIRPREIHVLFTREIEVRFDYAENTTGGTVATNAVDARFMDNVLPVPDTFLVVGGVKTPMGTYITIDQARPAWGAPPLVGLSELTHNYIQMCFVPENDMWGPLGITGTLDYNALWPPRIQAIQVHYRQTYRINRRWMDRIFQLRAYSVGTVDQTTGQRGPARAYADHCYFPAKKSLFKQIGELRAGGRGSGDLTLCTNVDGFPDSGIIDGTERPAPAHVSIPDSDQGIIHVQYVVDPLGKVEKVLPSKMDVANIPTADITQRSKSISFDSAPHAGRRPKLASAFKIAIIVTAIPASPNTEQQLHRIIIKPGELGKLIPGEVSMDAKGPILEIRVSASIETARIPWFDALAPEIEKAFGVRPGIPNFDHSVLNGTRTSDGNASLMSIALAEAASAYAVFVDRIEGSASGMLNPQITPGGWLAEVVHEITPQGVGKTSVNLPAQIPPLTLWKYLDKGTRATLMHSVERAA